MSKGTGLYHDAYANLAAAIIASGVKCHDTAFLKSDWCDILKVMCRLDDQMYGGRGISRSGSVILPTRDRRTQY